MKETLQFVIDHGYTLLFGWVLAEQLGLPLPSIPLLLAAGALAGVAKLNFGIALGLALAAAVLADSVWFLLGRRTGGKILGLLCRISLEPDSCVRNTEDRIHRNGARTLLFAKYVPGLSTAAPPLAGAVGMPFNRFLLFDLLGSILWAGGFLALGFVFADQIEALARYAGELGWVLILLLAVALAGYVALKFAQRRRFVKDLAVSRITAKELKAQLDAGEKVTIVDLRHALDWLPDPRTLPGAIRMRPDELDARHQEIPRDDEVVLYCT